MLDRRSRFEAQVLPYLDAAYRFARWLARSGDGADDVAQEALLRAYRSFDDLRSADAKAWLMQIVRNCHLTACQRQRQVMVPIADMDEAGDGIALISMAAGPEATAIQDGERLLLEQLIDAMPAEFREVLVLREIEELSYREIATVIGAPLGTVMSRLARGRAALRKQWLRRIGERRAMP